MIQRAAARDEQAQRTLIDGLRGVIHARVARRVGAWSRGSREDVKDLVQDVLAYLVTDWSQLLRWDPARGASLDNFVGLIAERKVVTELRKKWRKEKPVESDELEALRDLDDHRPDHEQQIISRDLVERAFERARRRLAHNETGLQMFSLIFIEARPVEEVCEITGMTRDAVYQWRSRLLALVRVGLDEKNRQVSRSSAELPEGEVP